MNQALQPYKRGISRRTFWTWISAIAVFYPALQFAGFRLPKKPIYVKIDKDVAGSGFLVTEQFILFDRDSRCWALSRRCTHLGCKLNYHEERDILECPCHQSQFHARTGKVVTGPAKKSLSFLTVEKRKTSPLYVVTT